MNDQNLISRQAAIDRINKQREYLRPDVYPQDKIGDAAYRICIEFIERLPSVQPKPCKDAVSRHSLLNDLKELTAAWGKYPVMAEQIKGVEAAIRYVEALPSAQPEITRCKDCKNWDTTWTNDFSPNYHYCPMVDGVRKEDWYCADAERRADE